MKNILLLFALANLVGCSSLPDEKTGLEGKPLPSFFLILSDSITRFNTADIPSGKPIVLYFFNPDCPYSRAEMGEIVSNMNTFKNIRIYVFTNSSFSDMKKFYKDYHLQNYRNIVAGIDTVGFFGNYFRVPIVPYMAIYDKQKRLKQVLPGKSPISLLKNIVSE